MIAVNRKSPLEALIHPPSWDGKAGIRMKNKKGHSPSRNRHSSRELESLGSVSEGERGLELL